MKTPTSPGDQIRQWAKLTSQERQLIAALARFLGPVPTNDNRQQPRRSS